MALLYVALVSVGASVVFVALLAAGVRSVITAKTGTRRGGATTVTLSLGYGCSRWPGSPCSSTST